MRAHGASKDPTASVAIQLAAVGDIAGALLTSERQVDEIASTLSNSPRPRRAFDQLADSIEEPFRSLGTEQMETLWAALAHSLALNGETAEARQAMSHLPDDRDALSDQGYMHLIGALSLVGDKELALRLTRSLPPARRIQALTNILGSLLGSNRPDRTPPFQIADSEPEEL